MNRRTTFRSLRVLALHLSLTAAALGLSATASAKDTEPPQPPELNVEQSDRYKKYQAALEHIAADRINQAYSLFVELWQASPAFDVAMAMADIELRRGHFAAAAEHYQYAKDHIPITDAPAFAQTIEQGLSEALANAATLHVRTSPPDASVTAGDTPVGSTHYFMPGDHTLTASKPGYLKVHETLRLREGEIRSIEFTLTPEPAAPSAPPTAYEPQRRSWILWVGGGATVAALATGAGLHLNVSSELNTIEKEIGASACATDQSADACGVFRSRRASAETKQTLANGFYITGAILALGTGALYQWWPAPVALKTTHQGPALTGAVLELTHAF